MERKSCSASYPMIDYCKVVCALLVVAIHCLEVRKGMGFDAIIVDCFSQQAVPFFFMVSGFFFGIGLKKNNMSFKYVCKYCLNLLILYCIWTILWMPSIISTYCDLYSDKSLFVLSLIIIRRIVFAGYGVYWYLLSLLESVMIVWILIRFNKTNILYMLAFIGLILGLMYDANIPFPIFEYIYKLFYVAFSWSNNVIMKGLPYVTFGILMSHTNKQPRHGSGMLLALYTFVSALNVITYNMCGFNQLYPIQAALLFVFALQFRSEKQTKSAILARELSGEIYFLHTVFIYLVIDKIWGVSFLFFAKYLMAVMFCLLTYIVIKKINYSKLNWLVNIK